MGTGLEVPSWASRLAGPCVALSYFATAKLGLGLPSTHESVTLIWPPTGIALAALLLSGGRLWAWVALAASAVTLTSDLGPGAAIGVALGNTVSMVASAALLRRVGFRPALERLADVGRLLVFGCAAGAAISATIGTLSLLAFTPLPAQEAASAWWIWWLGDGLGILFLSPLILTVADGLRSGRSRRPRWRVVLPSAAILAFFVAMFIAWRPEAGGHYVLLFGPVPLVTWIGLRSGPSGVAWLIFTLIATGTALTAIGVGPFVTQHPETGLLMLEGFAGGTALIGFLLAATRAEERAAAKRLRLAGTLFNNANEGIVIADPEGRIKLVNAAFLRLCGIPGGSVRGRLLDEFRNGNEDAADFHALRDRLEHGEATTGESRYGRSDGRAFPAWESYIAVEDERGELGDVIGIFSDISCIKDCERRLAHEARHDALTGLLNRGTFRHELERLLAQAKRHGRALGLLFIDLDRFKLINDTFGHQAGDELLAQVADRLCASVRAEDLVARLGGDEFTILLTGVVDREDVRLAAEKVADALHEPLALTGEKIVVRPSIGSAALPDDGDQADDLLRAADDAMFRAKACASRSSRSGRDEPTPRTELLRGESALVQSALAAGSLDLLYQPVVCGRSGVLVGMEALVSGLLPGLDASLTPRAFVDAAERLGESSRLTALVLSRVREDLEAWRAEGLEPAEVAVNIPGRLILSDSGVNELARLLSELDFASLRTRLSLELSEPALKATEHAREQLQGLRAGGFGFGLDGFGLGGTSLRDLREAPIDVVKIDRSLIGCVPGTRADEALCRSLVQVVGAMELRIIAVGVETPEQRDFLLEQGCRLMQGRLFHPPASHEDTRKLLQESRGRSLGAGGAPLA